MLPIILIAGVLVAVTVAVHAAGITVLLKALRRWHAILPTRFWRITRLLVVVTWWLVLLHLAEILVWGLCYLWWGWPWPSLASSPAPPSSAPLVPTACRIQR